MKKLILSPDTDVFHIGLPVIASTDVEVFVRLTPFNSLEHCLLDVQALIRALQNDTQYKCCTSALVVISFYSFMGWEKLKLSLSMQNLFVLIQPIFQVY